MSRVGKVPVVIPDKVKVSFGDDEIVVEGPKGKAPVPYRRDLVTVEEKDGALHVAPRNPSRAAKATWGTTRRLLANAVRGVTEEFRISLELVGVGYRAQAQGNKLSLTLGFSHPIAYVLPEGVKAEVAEATKITLTGPRKDVVGQVAAELRALRPPEPYKGKGVHRSGEHVRRKAGKSAAAGAGT